MNNNILKKTSLAVVSAAALMMSSAVFANGDAKASEQASAEEVKKLKMLESKVESMTNAVEQIIQSDQVAMVETPYLDAEFVFNERVNVALGSATLEEALTVLLPQNWILDLDITNPKLLNSRYKILSTSPRKEAVSKLLIQISNTIPGVKLVDQWFFDLTSEDGTPTPTLLIHQQ
ncbi:MAG: hypothetical protein D6B28_11625 [Gammaproteobacteria bacterium]|nr:MAG: hypothetical protein D6B28_11625 [Gammaproteobacteria bacterium]